MEPRNSDEISIFKFKILHKIYTIEVSREEISGMSNDLFDDIHGFHFLDVKYYNAIARVFKYVLDRGKDKELCEDLRAAYALDKHSAFIYSTSVTGERWEKDEIGNTAETIIASCPEHAYRYALIVIKNRWPQNEEVGRMAEETIAKTKYYSLYYANLLLRSKWPEGSEGSKNVALSSGSVENSVIYSKLPSYESVYGGEQ